ncbi:UNVERIFIED_CONTAM: hypothetical protein FKN15_022279 [Acipenser sinensis]
MAVARGTLALAVLAAAWGIPAVAAALGTPLLGGGSSAQTRDASILKIEAIIKDQFSVEKKNKEHKIEVIVQRLSEARRIMDKLRACIVANYYSNAGQPKVSEWSETPSLIHSETESLTHLSECQLDKEGEHLYKEEPGRQERRPGRNIGKDTFGVSSVQDTDQRVTYHTTGEDSSRLYVKKTIVVGNVSKSSSPLNQWSETPSLIHSETESLTHLSECQLDKEGEHLYKEEPGRQERRPGRNIGKDTFGVSSVQDTDQRVTYHTTGEDSSRLYVKKTIVVGNVSKYIPPDKREENDQSTHKWMVYVRGSRREPSIDHFVKKVWFFLHPSYKPNDLLDRTYTGLQTLEAETIVDVELHRHSLGEDYVSFPCSSAQSAVPASASRGSAAAAVASRGSAAAAVASRGSVATAVTWGLRGSCFDWGCQGSCFAWGRYTVAGAPRRGAAGHEELGGAGPPTMATPMDTVLPPLPGLRLRGEVAI